MVRAKDEDPLGWKLLVYSCMTTAVCVCANLQL